MQVIDIVIGYPMPVPVLATPVRAGFPSRAYDFVEEEIDLQRLLVVNRPATFLVRVAGDSMMLARLFDGDLAVVDRSLSPRTGDIVVSTSMGSAPSRSGSARALGHAPFRQLTVPRVPPCAGRGRRGVGRRLRLRMRTAPLRMSDQAYALSDGNSFYYSCERVFDARLAKVPVIVLSNNDGCAITRTNEAKALGIRIGEPWFTGRTRDRHFVNTHRVLSRAAWSPRTGARILLRLLVEAFAPRGPIVLALDDTIERRWGRRIQARGIYRDPVRSSGAHFVKTSGLRWMSLMLLAPSPWAGRV